MEIDMHIYIHLCKVKLCAKSDVLIIMRVQHHNVGQLHLVLLVLYHGGYFTSVVLYYCVTALQATRPAARLCGGLQDS